MGAWIETRTAPLNTAAFVSHPVWVRGLKLVFGLDVLGFFRSHPVWVRGLKLISLKVPLCKDRVAPRVGAWIETPASPDDLKLSESHPVWVRGLKHYLIIYFLLVRMSHPVWVRGLKQYSTDFAEQPSVAPRVGAWIETEITKSMSRTRQGRTPCGCVD